ncbi:hypothetical protein EV401DRAFT_1895936 [Pisolithus croceorrhizus]|nr:hypothetical protein EV401DRAFT_1895936 [Pisolithus croceorrhizus]
MGAGEEVGVESWGACGESVEPHGVQSDGVANQDIEQQGQEGDPEISSLYTHQKCLREIWQIWDRALWVATLGGESPEYAGHAQIGEAALQCSLRGCGRGSPECDTEFRSDQNADNNDLHDGWESTKGITKESTGKVQVQREATGKVQGKATGKVQGKSTGKVQGKEQCAKWTVLHYPRLTLLCWNSTYDRDKGTKCPRQKRLVTSPQRSQPQKSLSNQQTHRVESMKPGSRDLRRHLSWSTAFTQSPQVQQAATCKALLRKGY